MGKSALVANIAENAALANHPVVLFSLEMSEAELAQRFVASQARVKGEELRRGRVAETRWPKILAACQRLGQAPLFIDDSSDTGVLEVRAKSRRIHHQLQEQGGVGLIIVDYLQLMRHEGKVESRVEQVGQISRGLKGLARELGVPVIALSQLSRAVEQRGGDKKPILSDLRESGQIEQDADLVMFIYRDENYTKEESERPGEADLIIAKHRNGPVGDVTLTFQREYPKFMKYASASGPPDQRVPDGLCDGLGFRFDEERTPPTTALPTADRRPGEGSQPVRGDSAALPRRGIHRPPVTEIDPQIVAATRRFADPSGNGLTRGAACGSWGRSERARRPSRCSSPRRPSAPVDRSRSLAAAAAQRDPWHPSRRTLADRSAGRSDRRRPVHIDDIGAERNNERVLEEL